MSTPDTTPWQSPFAGAAHRFGDAPFVETPTETLSFAAFNRRASERCGGLSSQGIGVGTCVCLPAARTVETLLLWAACWERGAGVCMVDPAAPEDYTAARAAQAGCTHRAGVSLPGSGPFHTPETALVVFTSGSSGTPKAVCHGIPGMRHASRVTAAALDLRAGDRWLLSLPLHHVSGLSVVLRCAEAGAVCVLPPAGAPLAEALRSTQPTHVSLVATQVGRLLEQGVEPPASLRCALLGGGPSSASLIADALRGGYPVRNSYGMTETFAMIAVSRPDASADEAASAAEVIEPGTVRVGEGRIAVGGERLFLGYYRECWLDPARDADGFFLTEDLGILDGDRLSVLGRADTVFISGGENVAPEEVEEALLRLDGVEEAVVVPVPHAEFGRVPAAFLRTRDGSLPEISALRAALAAALPRHCLPRAVFPWPADAPAPSAKPDRAWWRARADQLAAAPSSKRTL
ncbi:MAG TPA: AMP-binding protein [Candidatus Hydrogenedentes bacterium]|nr:AMP-binding protein [Candidatus Hydrogenedentota bacterium]